MRRRHGMAAPRNPVEMQATSGARVSRPNQTHPTRPLRRAPGAAPRSSPLDAAGQRAAVVDWWCHAISGTRALLHQRLLRVLSEC
jgi:hypothetical protein